MALRVNNCPKIISRNFQSHENAINVEKFFKSSKKACSHCFVWFYPDNVLGLAGRYAF